MYLAMGMTYHEFWEMDPALAVDYRAAEDIKNDRKNQELWLQGMYIYEALCDVAPIMRAFPKKGTKPGKYPKEPYAINEKQRKRESDVKEKKMFEKGLAMMNAFTKANNERMQKKAEAERAGLPAPDQEKPEINNHDNVVD